MDGEAVVSLAQALWAGNADLAAAALAHPVHLPSRGRDAAPNAESIAVRNGSLTWTPIRQFTDKERPRQHDGSTMIRTRDKSDENRAIYPYPSWLRGGS